MIVAGTFYNIKCDCCGKIANEETWSRHIAIANYGADIKGFIRNLGGKDYCPDCYQYDEQGRIGTKDGRMFDENNEEVTV